MKRLLNQFLATIQLALRRTWTALGSHAAVALGVLVATTTICLHTQSIDPLRFPQQRYPCRFRPPVLSSQLGKEPEACVL
jgi:hypothetical protein